MKVTNFNLRLKPFPFTKFVASILCLSYVFMPFSVKVETAAAATSSCASIANLSLRKTCYVNEAAAAKKAADAKAAQAALVQTQISNLNGQIDQAQNTVAQTQNLIEDSENKISKLKAEIKVQADNLAQEKDKLNQVVASWYMEGESGLFETVMTSESVSELTTKQEYYDSIKTQMTSMIDQINALKDSLKSQQDEQEAQSNDLNALKSNQVAQQNSLQQNRTYKNRLLSNDLSAINDLNAQSQQATNNAAIITKQIEDAYRAAGGGKGKYSSAAIVHNSGGGVQLSVPAYSQNDPRWADSDLGTRGVSIGDFGCLITSMAMVGSYFGLGTNPLDIVNDSTFDSEGNFQGFRGNMGNLDGYESRKGYVNLDTIDAQLKRGHPVIVRAISNPQHWIVVTGGDQAHGYSWNDPYSLWNTPKNYTNFYDMRTFD